MGQHLQEEGNGKGKTKNTDATRAGNAQDEIRRETKRRQRFNAKVKNSSLAGTPLFEAINQDESLAWQESALDTALEVLTEDFSHTFVDFESDRMQKRFSEDIRQMAEALMSHLFFGEEADLVAAAEIPDDACERVQMLFVVVCVRKGVKDAHGQKAPWYNTMRQSALVRSAIKPVQVRRPAMA
jgi:hypothetical protein